MNLVVYYSKRKSKKREIISKSFLKGARGYKGFIIGVPTSKSKIEDVDLCVYVGWKRDVRKIVNSYYNIPKIVIFDAQIRSKNFHRYVYGYFGVCWNKPHRGYYYQDDLPDDRWKILKEKYQIEVKPWRKKGEHIVIAHQPNLNFDDKDRQEYYDEVIRKCLKTDREVLVCKSPVKDGRKLSDELESKWKSLGCKFSVGIEGNLDNAYCLISAGGTTQSRAVFQGIPFYGIEPNITDPLNISKGFNEFIKSPSTPNRKSWLNWIAYQQWTLEEMKKGLTFKYIMGIKRYIYNIKKI